MKRNWRGREAALIVVLAARAAAAEVNGSYDGQIVASQSPVPIAAAAALTQTVKLLSGTIAIGGEPAALGGAYIVTGRASATKFKLNGGSATGAILKWRGKIVGETLQGKVRLRQARVRVAGTFALQRNLVTADGSSCDAVFEQNQTFFVDQVLGNALNACTVCHVPGGQAAATRLQVAPSDPLATARSIAPLIDAVSPMSSRLMAKPLGLVPHGGQQQIMAGSNEEAILLQWIDLVVQAHCL